MVEDDDSALALVLAALQEEHHLVRAARNLQEGQSALERGNTDLLILDRGLPDGDGIKFCLNLRKDARFKDLPVLILSGKGETGDRVLGLRFGADDYLVKPFEVEELLARVDALMRRAQPAPGAGSGRLAVGGVVMNIPGRQVLANGDVVPLSNTEYELLRVLMERAGTALTREFLLQAVWRSVPGKSGEKIVDVTILNLRRKLGALGTLIESSRSYGYKMAARITPRASV